MTGLSIKLVVVVVGVVLSVVGIVTNQWKVAVVGNSIGIAALLFV